MLFPYIRLIGTNLPFRFLISRQRQGQTVSGPKWCFDTFILRYKREIAGRSLSYLTIIKQRKVADCADLVCSEMGINSEVLLEQRAIIKYLTRRGTSGTDIHQQLVEQYGKDNAMKIRTVRGWRGWPC